ncbi:rSAM-partnered protein [Halorhabdus sp. CBA1104]|uniref:Htur_1727 family rSAM-partnered candidate RiPP n=1 Tax=Halorhabdus sp. CBA1104 TaxID=1380432 RepID=UPI0012B2E939|nr:Htur_1727 family rSAM-partnered candidate RiPP [Halorhabdus sp. CBA1104]QGN07477.1 rSAM-partnered protein [Halorhabdus sp. CBA1104]
MTDDANTFETGTEPRGRQSREWEVFVRETEGEPLEHVGSVTADEQAQAREQATTLFEDPVAIWLCPEEAVFRYTDTALTPGETA